MNAIVQKVLGAWVVILMALGVGLSLYGVSEHRKAATALDGQRIALAAAATSASEARASRAALTALTTGQAKARATQAAAEGKLQTAIDANAPAMGAPVADAVWDSIFGADDAK